MFARVLLASCVTASLLMTGGCEKWPTQKPKPVPMAPVILTPVIGNHFMFRLQGVTDPVCTINYMERGKSNVDIGVANYRTASGALNPDFTACMVLQDSMLIPIQNGKILWRDFVSPG